jgi:hypothetical protein
MGVIGDKKSIRISLDMSPLFFFTVFKVILALVVTYDEIFQALSVEGNFLLLKPFLVLGLGGVVIWKSPASERFLPIF